MLIMNMYVYNTNVTQSPFFWSAQMQTLVSFYFRICDNNLLLTECKSRTGNIGLRSIFPSTAWASEVSEYFIIWCSFHTCFEFWIWNTQLMTISIEMDYMEKSHPNNQTAWIYLIKSCNSAQIWLACNDWKCPLCACFQNGNSIQAAFLVLTIWGLFLSSGKEYEYIHTIMYSKCVI